jgi:hypothetical protein
VLGFYEADVVKRHRKKGLFECFGLIFSEIRQQLTCGRLWCLIGAV